MKLQVQQIPTVLTPFRYKFSGGDLIGYFTLDLLPNGVKLTADRGQTPITCETSYARLCDWVKRLEDAILSDSGEKHQIDCEHDEGRSFLRFVYYQQYERMNQLYIGAIPVIAGRMSELEPLIEIFRIATMMPMFLHTAVETVEQKLNFFEEQYGTYEDHHCPYCGNILEDNDECMYCWECESCGFHNAHDGLTCDKCGTEREEEE